MAHKYNPFKPNSPVYTGMFAGRGKEIERIDEILYQTKHGNPTHILINGERGIGKSSLLLVANHFSKGTLAWEDDKYDFLTIQINIDKDTTLIDLAEKLRNGISRELNKTNQGVAFMQKVWAFIQKLEVAGIKYRQDQSGGINVKVIDDVIFSLADTIKTITSDNAVTELGLIKKKDGIVLLIDEADNASKLLNLGGFLKNLTETLIAEGVNNLLIILAGLPRLKEIIRDSHESALRLFEEFELPPLTKEEVKNVIRSGLKEANEHIPGVTITITDEALDNIYFYSEGYPHFVQQIGACVFAVDADNNVTAEDVKNGMFMKGSAIDLIGNRYYDDLYYNRINVDSYRRILSVMAQKWDMWISKAEIKKEFKGSAATLTNGLKALRDRNVILSRKGAKGQYRLQWRSFAFWINAKTRQVATLPKVE